MEGVTRTCFACKRGNIPMDSGVDFDGVGGYGSRFDISRLSFFVCDTCLLEGWIAETIKVEDINLDKPHQFLPAVTARECPERVEKTRKAIEDDLAHEGAHIANLKQWAREGSRDG